MFKIKIKNLLNTNKSDSLTATLITDKNQEFDFYIPKTKPIQELFKPADGGPELKLKPAIGKNVPGLLKIQILPNKQNLFIETLRLHYGVIDIETNVGLSAKQKLIDSKVVHVSTRDISGSFEVIN